MEKPVVTIHDGKVQGIISEDFEGGKFYKFLGIPYGKPPTGPLRFKVSGENIISAHFLFW